MNPKRLTLQQSDRLIAMALELAVKAPAKRRPAATTAAVPWATIEELRQLLDDVGFDWRTLNTIHRQEQAEARP